MRVLPTAAAVCVAAVSLIAACGSEVVPEPPAVTFAATGHISTAGTAVGVWSCGSGPSHPLTRPEGQAIYYLEAAPECPAGSTLRVQVQGQDTDGLSGRATCEILNADRSIRLDHQETTGGAPAECSVAAEP